jgi:Bacterial CdiA-CT RNAse A domain
VIPALARERAQQQAAIERARAAEDAALAAEIDDLRRAQAAINEEVKELNDEMARWRRRVAEEEAKYSPSQPRVPAGNPRGGRWTDRSGGQGTVTSSSQDTGQGTGTSLAEPMGDLGIEDVSGSSETGDLFQIKPDEPRAQGVQLAGEPVDLLEEERRGGHPVTEHAGKTYGYLKSRVQDEARRTLERGDDFQGFSVGSFTSVQSANRLVNSTISDNQDKIDQVARGEKSSATISKKFPSPTGYEAYLSRAHAEPYIRDTFGVEVVIRPDRGSARGWRVHTAYPVR